MGGGVWAGIDQIARNLAAALAPGATLPQKLSGAASAGVSGRCAAEDHQHGANIVGIADGTSAAQGEIGETISGTILASAYPPSGTYGDAGILGITAGRWVISGGILVTKNTAVMAANTATQFMLLDVVGNVTTGLVWGKNSTGTKEPQSGYDAFAAIPEFVYVTPVPKQIYFKIMASYTSGSPLAYGYMQARRF